MRWAAFVAVVVALEGSAHAANVVANVDDDVDGDGKADHILLSGDGVLHIEAGRTTTLKVTGVVTAATLGVAHPATGPLIVVDLVHEAVIVGIVGGTWRELTRFPIGDVGDGEYRIEVAATPKAVLRYQRGRVLFCPPKQPAYLFPEAFNAATGQFAPTKPPITIDAAAPTLPARLDPTPPTSPPLVYQAHGVSMELGATNAGMLNLPSELDDGKLDTSWRTPGDGSGQFVTFVTRIPSAFASQLRIVPGNQASAALLHASNRPKRLGVVTPTGAWWVELPDAQLGAAYVVDLPGQVPACVSVVIDKTYGSATTTAISELEVYAAGERTTSGDALLAKAIADGTDEQRASAALARRGATGVAAIETELAARTDAAGRHRLLRALVANRDPSAAAMLAKLAGEAKGTDLVAVIDALGAIGGGATTLEALAGQRDLEMPARLAAVRALRATSPDGLAALAKLAGHGPRELRAGIIDALGPVPADMLVQLASSATAAPTSGDLWRALVQSSRRDPGRRQAAVAALVAALPGVSDYERSYRIIEGLATLGDAAALQALATALRALPVDAKSAALRQVAARGFASAPRPEASDFVLALVTDPDPGVRLAALAAIGSTHVKANPWNPSGGPESIDRVIVTALGGDRWPEIRQRAAEALATRCDRPAPAKALEGSVTGDPDVNVAGAALAALVDCHAAVVVALLPRVWDNAKLPLILRARAVDLAVALGDRSLGPTLVARFASWRGAAMQSADALELARHAAPAIGRLAPANGSAALLDALDDSGYPEIVAAAAAGLGFLGPACPAPAKAKLRTLATSEEQQIQLAASRALAQCGH